MIEFSSAPNSADARITALYAPLADKIVDTIPNAAQRDIACVVTGPYQSGKSGSLIPQIQRGLGGLGFDTLVVDCRHYEISPEMSLGYDQPRVESGRPAVLILDEAGDPKMIENEVETLTFFKDLGYETFVPVIAHPIQTNSQELGREMQARWQQHEPEQISDTPIITVSPRLIAPELATQYLKERGIDEAAVSGIIKRVGHDALYLMVLDAFRFGGTLSGIDNTLSGYYHVWKHSLPPAALKRIFG
jgi:hypothetical protein